MTSKFIAMAAAVVASVSTAGAADLGHPVKAAVDYVKVCDTYGAGFFYIPGSDTCLKLGGRVYMDERVGGGVYSRENHQNSVYGDKSHTGNPYFTRAAAYFNFDARTNTEFGLLRSYIETRYRYSTGSPVSAGTELDLPSAYIQLGGLLVGKARSAFDFTPAGYTLNMDYGVFQTNTLVNEIAYTFAFGNGVSATVALLDATTADQTYNNLLRNEKTDSYAGNRLPDVVANLNITQAWGSAQIAAAYHDDYSVSHGEKAGYAFNAGIEYNLGMIAKGDKIALQAGYASGAQGYITALNSGSGTISKVFAPGNYIGEDWAVDANGNIRQTKTWGGIVSLHHEFNPNFEVNFDATYLNVNGYGARDLYTYGLQSDVRWKPTASPKFYIALGLEYGALNYTSATRAANPPITNENGWEAALRVNRSF